jgi:hypothetical protein
MILHSKCFKDEITGQLQKIHNSTFIIIRVTQIGLDA